MSRVLVVDDSTMIHAMYRSVLARLPTCSVTYAKNGVEALALVTSEGAPDIVFLDVNMPVMDGMECLSRLGFLGLLSQTRVVMVSTESADDDVARALAQGATAYLKKPFRREDLEAMVERCLSSAP